MLKPKLSQPWTPQQDVDQAFEYSDPVAQNRAILNGLRNDRTSVGMNPQWDDYFGLLAAKNAHVRGGLDNMGESLPAGYTQDQLDTENADALTGGTAPRWADSTNLPDSQQHIKASMQGLRKALGKK